MIECKYVRSHIINYLFNETITRPLQAFYFSSLVIILVADIITQHVYLCFHLPMQFFNRGSIGCGWSEIVNFTAVTTELRAYDEPNSKEILSLLVCKSMDIFIIFKPLQLTPMSSIPQNSLRSRGVVLIKHNPIRFQKK